MKHDDIAEALAPQAPPCFESRSSWVSYVRAAASAHHKGDAPGPLMFLRGVIAIDPDAGLSTAPDASDVQPILTDKGREIRFNPEFSYCAECDRSFAARKKQQGLCKPTHLRDLLAPSKEPTALTVYPETWP